jgi:hypothetical protein
MKFTRVTKISMAAVGTLLLVWIGLIVFTASSSRKLGPAAVNKTTCPDCSSLLNKNGDCPKCMAEMGLDAYRQRNLDKGFSANPIIAIALAVVFGLLLAVHIGINIRARVKAKKVEVYYHVRCTKCGRKLRYRDVQIEHPGKCPICQKPIRFPKPPEKPKINRWVKIAHLVWG